MTTTARKATMPGTEEALLALTAKLGDAVKLGQETAGSARKRLNDAREGRVATAQGMIACLCVGVVLLVAAPHAPWLVENSGLRGRTEGFGAMAMMLAYVMGSLLLYFPLAHLVVQAGEGDMAEENAAVAVAGARRSVDEANRVMKAVQDTADEHGVWNADCEMARRLAETVVSAAKANRGLENRVRGTAAAASRRDERITPRNQRVVLTRADNRTLIVNVVDLSVSGAGITGNIPGVKVGSTVRLGSRQSVVVRATKGGFGLKFVKSLEPSQLNPGIVL